MTDNDNECNDGKGSCEQPCLSDDTLFTLRDGALIRGDELTVGNEILVDASERFEPVLYLGHADAVSTWLKPFVRLTLR